LDPIEEQEPGHGDQAKHPPGRGKRKHPPVSRRGTGGRDQGDARALQWRHPPSASDDTRDVVPRSQRHSLSLDKQHEIRSAVRHRLRDTERAEWRVHHDHAGLCQSGTWLDGLCSGAHEAHVKKQKQQTTENKKNGFGHFFYLGIVK